MKARVMPCRHVGSPDSWTRPTGQTVLYVHPGHAHSAAARNAPGAGVPPPALCTGCHRRTGAWLSAHTPRSTLAVTRLPLIEIPLSRWIVCSATAVATSTSENVSFTSIRPSCPFASPTSLINAPTRSFGPTLSFFPTVRNSLTQAAPSAAGAGGDASPFPHDVPAPGIFHSPT